LAAPLKGRLNFLRIINKVDQFAIAKTKIAGSKEAKGNNY
jgi:hypothetical protein